METIQIILGAVAISAVAALTYVSHLLYLSTRDMSNKLISRNYDNYMNLISSESGETKISSENSGEDLVSVGSLTSEDLVRAIKNEE